MIAGICKFCGCSDERPCFITADFLEVPSCGVPCAWLLEDVCSTPACVDKAYAEARPLAEAIMEAAA